MSVYHISVFFSEAFFSNSFFSMNSYFQYAHFCDFFTKKHLEKWGGCAYITLWQWSCVCEWGYCIPDEAIAIEQLIQHNPWIIFPVPLSFLVQGIFILTQVSIVTLLVLSTHIYFSLEIGNFCMLSEGLVTSEALHQVHLFTRVKIVLSLQLQPPPPLSPNISVVSFQISK